MKKDSDQLENAALDVEHRRHARARLKLVVQLRFNSVEEFMQEYATNVSLGGMFIVTDVAYEVGDLVALQLSLESGGKLIEGLARVVHCKVTGGVVKGIGVEFVDLDEASERLIEEIVESHLQDG